jgi:hypothetical protein
MRYLLFLFISIISISASAQFSVGGRAGSFDASHVNWTFTVSKVENKYTIEAVANLESGWHIFSSAPGGDGSLTPTQIEVEQIANLKIPVETKESGNAIEKDMDGIGVVKYYEHRASFKIVFVAPADLSTFTGKIDFQICNDVMCMAPTTKSFTVTLK